MPQLVFLHGPGAGACVDALTLAANLRVGYLVAPPDLVQPLTD